MGSKDADKEEHDEADLATTPEEAIANNNHNNHNNPKDVIESQQEENDQVLHQNTPIALPPPDGGYGWVCTACCATINAHTWGMNSSYGVFLAHYLRNNIYPGATSLEYALIGSLSISLALLISPVATLTTRYYGTKTTLFMGIFLETASFIGASFAKKIWQLFLTQGVCFGLGMGFLFVGSVGIPAQWFTKRRSLANGISAAGSGIGGLIYSLATGAMLQSIGIAWTFRVLGILAFSVNSICALLLRDRNAIIQSRQNAFDYRLFHRAEYLLLCIYGWFSMLAYVVLIFSLANYANFIGLDASDAAIVSALLNLGQALGRPPIGYFSDSIGRLNMAAMMTAAAGLFSFAIWIPAKSFGVLVFFALIGGAVAGTFWATISPLAAEIGGLRNNASALNLIWLVIVLPCTFSEPIALEIVNGTGSYLGTQVFTGFMYLSAATCLVLLRGWKVGELAELAKIREEGIEDVSDEMVANGARKVGRRRIWWDWAKWQKV